MAHGYPDFGLTQGAVTTHGVRDLGEAVARLGAPNLFDRRGELIWFDDFEDAPGKWNTVTQGTGASSDRSTTVAWRGGASWALKSGDASGDHATMSVTMTVPPVGKQGFEFSFSVDQTPNAELRFDLQRREDLVSRQGRITIDLDSGEVYYRASSGSNVLLTTQDFASNTRVWNHVKLVVDFATDEYVRVLLNNEAFSLGGIDLFSSAAGATTDILALIRCETSTAAARTIYVDDVILTQNEP